jgi:hypothetical protein
MEQHTSARQVEMQVELPPGLSSASPREPLVMHGAIVWKWHSGETYPTPRSARP